MSASLNSFKVLTFDCYGTLIDWETGIHAAMQSLLEEAGVSPSREALLEMFAKLESAQQVATPDLPYSDLLTEVHRQLADLLEVNMSDAAHRRFGASVADWPAFSDTVPALEYLQEHHKLAILSNVDNASFKGSNRRLEVTFDAVYTAQDIGSYKPNRRNFEFMLARLAELGFEKTDILHVAQSLFHDHQPAKSAGLACAWIDRCHDTSGWGATPPPATEVAVDFRFDSLADLVSAHRKGVTA